MDRYRKLENQKPNTPIHENEIRITSRGRIGSYIAYAMSLFQEKGWDEIVFKAMGQAINNAVIIVELIKGRIFGLHQITSITSVDISDTWEPLEESLIPLQTTRHVSAITIILSKRELDASSVGYQPPIPADQVEVSIDVRNHGRGRGGGRGGNFQGRGIDGYNGPQMDSGGYNQEAPVQARGWGRGRGRGRGTRGRGRGFRSNRPINSAPGGRQ